jgi:siroheme synthase-like protein
MTPDPATPLPVQLDVRGRRCVVVGAGPVGARRAATLVEAGAAVEVVAPRVSPPVRALAEQLAIVVHQRGFEPTDLDGALLVVAATGVEAVDEAVSMAAAPRGVLVNRADRAGRGNLTFPAVVRRGPVRVAVSTGGAAPAVARLLAAVLDEQLDTVLGLDLDDLSTLVEVVEEVRAQLGEQSYAGPTQVDGTARDEGVTPGPLDWRSALDASILDLIRQGRRAEAKERLLACLSSS